MWRVRWTSSWWIVLALGSASCTKPNPKNCSDGSCTDPSLPFCDVDGSVGGEANTCIAVACTANAFESCRGDLAITCNAQGNNFDEIRCNKGCDPTVGCRVCDPDQTVCADGKVQTCDASGAVTASQTCALGCFEDQPRCREIDPSNNLASYLDMFPDAPDIDLTNATIDTKTGVVTDGTMSISIPNVLVPQSPAGIRVYVVGSAKIKDLVVGKLTSGPFFGPAVAIVARGDISITGTISVNSAAGGFTTGCTAGSGHMLGLDDDVGFIAAGSGGGGNATPGSRGGNFTNDMTITPGAGGNPVGTDHLIPLQGGCPGAVGIDDKTGQPYGLHGALGGGAIQLSSRTEISVDGTIDVRGNNGFFADYGQTNAGLPVGAGAGGGIILEAPSVQLNAQAKMLAAGGTGAGCSPATAACALGGAGATMGNQAVPGGDTNSGAGEFVTTGGGGGGWGRVRINTADATYIKSNTAIEDGALTTGILATR